MPSQQTLDRFVSLVEQAEFLRAMEEFYAENASMQENFRPPRVGKAALLEHERKTLANTRRVTTTRIGPVFMNGDFVVIRWRFAFEGMDGKVATIEELAYQRWQGEQIVEEQFFYDPGQMGRAA